MNANVDDDYVTNKEIPVEEECYPITIYPCDGDGYIGKVGCSFIVCEGTDNLLKDLESYYDKLWNDKLVTKYRTNRKEAFLYQDEVVREATDRDAPNSSHTYSLMMDSKIQQSKSITILNARNGFIILDHENRKVFVKEFSHTSDRKHQHTIDIVRSALLSYTQSD